LLLSKEASSALSGNPGNAAGRRTRSPARPPWNNPPTPPPPQHKVEKGSGAGDEEKPLTKEEWREGEKMRKEWPVNLGPLKFPSSLMTVSYDLISEIT